MSCVEDSYFVRGSEGELGTILEEQTVSRISGKDPAVLFHRYDVPSTT